MQGLAAAVSAAGTACPLQLPCKVHIMPIPRPSHLAKLGQDVGQGSLQVFGLSIPQEAIF